jgi:hypothetical protein
MDGGVEDLPTYEQLVELEPRLRDLEEWAEAIRDDGESPWFCSNFVWMPVQGSLKALVGVHRIPQPGDDLAGPLFDSRCFEVVYLRLSRLLPPCRDCGCVLFERQRRRELA